MQIRDVFHKLIRREIFFPFVLFFLVPTLVALGLAYQDHGDLTRFKNTVYPEFFKERYGSDRGYYQILESRKIGIDNKIYFGVVWLAIGIGFYTFMLLKKKREDAPIVGKKPTESIFEKNRLSKRTPRATATRSSRFRPHLKAEEERGPPSKTLTPVKKQEKKTVRGVERDPMFAKMDMRKQVRYEKWTRLLSRFRTDRRSPSKSASEPHCEICGEPFDDIRRESACEYCDRIVCHKCVKEGSPQEHITTCTACIDFFAIMVNESPPNTSMAASRALSNCSICGRQIGDGRQRAYCEFCNRALCTDCVEEDTPEPYIITCKACIDLFTDIHPPKPGKSEYLDCDLCGRSLTGERYKEKCSFCGEVLCSECVLEDTPGEKAKTCKACVVRERLRMPGNCEICGKSFDGRKYDSGSKRRRAECRSCTRIVCNECIEGDFSGTCMICREEKRKPAEFSTGVICYTPGACFYCGKPFGSRRRKVTCSFCYHPVCNECVVRDAPGRGWNTCKHCITEKRLRMKVSELKRGGCHTCEICAKPFDDARLRSSCNSCSRTLCRECVEEGVPEKKLNTCKDCLERYTIPALKAFARTAVAPNTHPPIRNLCSICEKPLDERWRGALCHYCNRTVCTECAYENTPDFPFHTCKDCMENIRAVKTSQKNCDICKSPLSDDPGGRFRCNSCSRILCEDCVHHNVTERYMNTCKRCIEKVSKDVRTICELCGMNLISDFYGHKGFECDFCSRIVCHNCTHNDPRDPALRRCNVCMKHLDMSCEICGKALNFDERTSCDYCSRILCRECIHFDVPDHHCRTCEECLKSW